MKADWKDYQLYWLKNWFNTVSLDAQTTKSFLDDWNPTKTYKADGSYTYPTADEVNPFARMLGVRTDNPNASGLPLLAAGGIQAGAVLMLLDNPKLSEGQRNTLLIVLNLLHGAVVYNNMRLNADNGNINGNYFKNRDNTPAINNLIQFSFPF